MFTFFSLVAMVTAFVKIVFYIHFWEMPLLFFAVGLAATFYNRKYSLYLFFFLFPFINSTPAFFDKGFSFNYMAPSLFLLSGIIIALLSMKLLNLKSGKASITKAIIGYDINQRNRDFYLYYLFLLVLVISTVFVLLRWSNITLANAAAIGADTPIAPDSPQSAHSLRISFGSIFPVVSIFLYFISPYIFFYIKEFQLKEVDVFKWLSYGFWISVAAGVAQKISGKSLISDRLGKELKQFYAGFSDFNAFGFFSGVMFLWSTYAIRDKNKLGYVSFVVSLVGAILSGSRTVFFFILAGLFNLFYGMLKERKKQQRIVVVGLVLGAMLFIIFAGGTLVKRLGEGFDEKESMFRKLDAISNGRLWMTLFTLETIKDNPVSGIGTGNFTFFLGYKNYLPFKQENKKYLYDLPLNHYLLIFVENGVFGFLFFTGFLIFLWRRSSKKLLLGTILFSLLFNNFFWFPEAFLLFWVLAALNDNPKTSPTVISATHKKKGIITLMVLVMVLVFSIIRFNALHPQTWAQETQIRYDYGFWYQEQDDKGEPFYWTESEAGLYLSLGKKGESRRFNIFCGAPLAQLRGKEQRVQIYWKGKLINEVLFKENRLESFTVKSKPGDKGFLEIKVIPTFNEQKLGLSEEARDLGVRLYQVE
jgi:O-Antigen ligase